ncbi:MAG: DNA repair protein RecO C-terminal domain-containing protein [Firmicutes bacterium]|nr:DNA repair protein RecO C-terminal domain-containing protein [Bacillota bacterium]
MKREISVLNCQILGTERVKEYDLRLTVFSEEGIKRFNAVGVLRPTAKLRGALQLFNETEVTLMGGKITSATVIKNNTAISRDINRYYLASSICETLSGLLKDPDDYTEIYALAGETLANLADTDISCFVLFIEFYSELLALLGFAEKMELGEDLGLSQAREIIRELEQGYKLNLEYEIPNIMRFY